MDRTLPVAVIGAGPIGPAAAAHLILRNGPVLTTRILHSMKRDGLRRGIVTLCIGGGQGIAFALQMIG